MRRPLAILLPLLLTGALVHAEEPAAPTRCPQLAQITAQFFLPKVPNNVAPSEGEDRAKFDHFKDNVRPHCAAEVWSELALEEKLDDRGDAPAFNDLDAAKQKVRLEAAAKRFDDLLAGAQALGADGKEFDAIDKAAPKFLELVPDPAHEDQWGAANEAFQGSVERVNEAGGLARSMVKTVGEALPTDDLSTDPEGAVKGGPLYDALGAALGKFRENRMLARALAGKEAEFDAKSWREKYGLIAEKLGSLYALDEGDPLLKALKAHVLGATEHLNSVNARLKAAKAKDPNNLAVKAFEQPAERREEDEAPEGGTEGEGRFGFGRDTALGDLKRQMGQEVDKRILDRIFEDMRGRGQVAEGATRESWEQGLTASGKRDELLASVKGDQQGRFVRYGMDGKYQFGYFTPKKGGKGIDWHGSPVEVMPDGLPGAEDADKLIDGIVDSLMEGDDLSAVTGGVAGAIEEAAGRPADTAEIVAKEGGWTPVTGNAIGPRSQGEMKSKLAEDRAAIAATRSKDRGNLEDDFSKFEKEKWEELQRKEREARSANIPPAEMQRRIKEARDEYTRLVTEEKQKRDDALAELPVDDEYQTGLDEEQARREGSVGMLFDQKTEEALIGTPYRQEAGAKKLDGRARQADVDAYFQEHWPTEPAGNDIYKDSFEKLKAHVKEKDPRLQGGDWKRSDVTQVVDSYIGDKLKTFLGDRYRGWAEGRRDAEVPGFSRIR